MDLVESRLPPLSGLQLELNSHPSFLFYLCLRHLRQRGGARRTVADRAWDVGNRLGIVLWGMTRSKVEPDCSGAA